MNTDQTSQERPIPHLEGQEFIEIIKRVKKKKYSKFYGIVKPYGRCIIIKNVTVGAFTFKEDWIVKLPIILDNVHFDFFEIKNGIFEKLFRVEDCTFHGEFRIEGGIFRDALQIKDNTFCRYFLIKDGIFEGFSLIVHNVFEGYSNIRGGYFKSDLWIEKSYFNGEFTIEGGKFYNRVWFVEVTFNMIATILRGSFQGRFGLVECSFEKKFWIYGPRGAVNFHYSVEIRESTFQGPFVFEEGKANSIVIKKLNSKIDLDIREKFIISRLNIQDILTKESLVIISGKFYLLKFMEFLNFGTIVLKSINLKTDTLRFSNLIPFESNSFRFGKLRLSEQNKRPRLHIEKSDLGRITIIDSNLSDFDFILKSSKITDMSIVGSVMPGNIQTVDSNEKPDYHQHQFGYGQIKKIYESVGNKVEANRYYGKEMNAYYTKLSWSKEFWEKINLQLNKISTNFGQSWERGVLTTLFVSILFFVSYCCTLGYHPAWPKCENLKLFARVAPYIFEFINPIHKADYVAQQLLCEGERISGLSRFIEGVSRIFIAYFVYQLIQAFRKHGKSSV